MNHKFPKSLLLLLGLVLCLLSIPKSSAEKMRGITVAASAPMWDTLAHSKLWVQSWFGKNQQEIEDIQRLQLENKLLQEHLASLMVRMRHEQTVHISLEDSVKNPLHAYHLQAIPAMIIYRSPASWSSSLWLNVGKKNNPSIDNPIIAKNSPVVIGNSIVGIVDYVDEKQCRVRLITDSGLATSVRAVRKKLGTTVNSWHHLAKGELHGHSQPLWRAPEPILKGIGFNYDFPDEFGPARNLQSGLPVTAAPTETAIPLISVHDLLITTGMDGVFPAGLHVAEVTKVEPLREGDYYYELEAKPTAGNLHDLTLVFVLPPLSDLVAIK